MSKMKKFGNAVVIGLLTLMVVYLPLLALVNLVAVAFFGANWYVANAILLGLCSLFSLLIGYISYKEQVEMDETTIKKNIVIQYVTGEEQTYDASDEAEVKRQTDARYHKLVYCVDKNLDIV